MKKTLQIINQMQKECVFKKYAIGGGIAALFYIEPIATFDLDVFIILNDKSLLASLTPIYSWLKQKGYKTKNEQIIIEGIPVQFIPVYNDMVKEAVLNSCKKKYLDTTSYVLKKEYLIAIMLQTNRQKDRERILMFLEETKISFTLLENILSEFDLIKAWNSFRKRFNIK